ncbi:UNVERIFIED_CONTAM: hypothetical protein PYX00_009181 [Menopon gallinae]|uniref:SAM domain-containing protein n=1 Tax=Menopon gallinae TaxID=328185 RepID=A0AAW2HAK8_9NEOP
MAADYTRQWIQFFTGCGIPEDVATTYGLIFNENRIQKNMLLDLNKEYLRDMGITVMGDVIAILRHAKVVHDKYAREQVLSEPSEKLDNYLLNDGGSPTKPATPMKRVLEHYTRKYESSEMDVSPKRVQIQIENDKSLVNVPKKLAHRIGIQNKTGVRQKIEAPSMRSDDLVPGKLEVPVPKTRRVLPEEEGGYTVKMPSGVTERSKKLLEKAKLRQNKTVFDRLGESSVSSTSDVTSASGTTVSKLSGNREKTASSVFSRLGEKSSLVTSTSSNGDSPDLVDQLPYRGILKSNVARKPVKTRRGLSPNSTMRADKELHLSKTNNTKVKKINLKERLGTAVKGKQTPSTGAKNLNRIQIITTFEEEDEPPPKVQTLSKRFESVNAANDSFKEKKNVLDGVGTLRSEMMQAKSKVSSTTQLPEVKRGMKRRLADANHDFDSLDGAQSKKVRFGQTTQRLIPGNAADFTAAAREYRNLAMRIGNNEISETKAKLTLTSGVRIGPLNSDKMKQKLSVKDRIGVSMLPKAGRVATDLKKKRSLKLNNRLKKRPISIHDRLG